ncbi:extensin-2-like [Ziziphus jujuba]|uniref:Extensin-2-like n=1 Tax=Ziziphus jujuba TaxID=326968 RepID=A0ABM3ZSY2_ZIZJJ|nr:extensin-2-like [Ziziphus jujuba]
MVVCRGELWGGHVVVYWLVAVSLMICSTSVRNVECRHIPQHRKIVSDYQPPYNYEFPWMVLLTYPPPFYTNASLLPPPGTFFLPSLPQVLSQIPKISFLPFPPPPYKNEIPWMVILAYPPPFYTNAPLLPLPVTFFFPSSPPPLLSQIPTSAPLPPQPLL